MDKTIMDKTITAFTTEEILRVADRSNPWIARLVEIIEGQLNQIEHQTKAITDIMAKLDVVRSELGEEAGLHV